MVNNRIEIPFVKLFDKNFMQQNFNKMAESSEADNIFVTGAKGISSKEVLDLYAMLAGFKIESNSPLAKTIQDKNKTAKNGIFKMPSAERGPDGNFYLGVDDKLFGTEKEYDWKKEEKERFEKADGKIGNFKQGSGGDCWLLSRLAAKDDGIIKKEKDGSFTVTLNNPDKREETHKIKVTKDDFSDISNRNLSSGDPDAKIVEIATKKLFESLKINNGSIRENSSAMAFGMLSKKPSSDLLAITASKDPTLAENKQLQEHEINDLENQLKEICSTSKAIAAITTSPHNDVSFTGNHSVNTDKLIEGHAYTLVKTDPTHKSVTIKNPYDTSKNLTISYAEFAENFCAILYENE